MADRTDRHEPTADELEDQADAVADFVEELLARMGIDGIAEPVDEGGRMYVDVVDAPDEDLSLLIGTQGQTLDAIQELARQVVSRQLGQRVRVIVDVQDHRKRRDRDLIERARTAATEVAADGAERSLEPMNALERKLVHDAIADVAGVETVSRGEDPARYVVIRPVTE
ncbi:MAG TPA: R3H domain-containing nucleic acid-binding protein [Actinomycetota bacterium]|nr:R3H domain-containing nucleic acid-binding protein [Actinomycetota bacterium]